jgi:hypothetical protein
MEVMCREIAGMAHTYNGGRMGAHQPELLVPDDQPDPVSFSITHILRFMFAAQDGFLKGVGARPRSRIYLKYTPIR